MLSQAKETATSPISAKGLMSLVHSLATLFRCPYRFVLLRLDGLQFFLEQAHGLVTVEENAG